MVRGVTYFEASNKVTADALTFDSSPLSPLLAPSASVGLFYALFRFTCVPMINYFASDIRTRLRLIPPARLLFVVRNERSGIPMKRSSLFHLPRSEACIFIGSASPSPRRAPLLFLLSART